MKKQTKKPCKYCGGLTNGDVCGHCKDKLPLVKDLLQMVQNKAEEVGYFDTHKK
jgi:recombinational DNA repair protein RecR